MSQYEKTTTPNMVIDKATGAVINTDIGGYHAIKKAREERRKALVLEDRVTALEDEVKTLRQLIKMAAKGK